ncbi:MULTISPECIES: hypothetical protein [unclassified Streptomyces]|uniref:hypothetical protein n=1 Tax=unclassified Streptomyces TaxID=2593676 RepID=UPI0036537958
MTRTPSALLLTCDAQLVDIDLPFGHDDESSAERRAVIRARPCDAPDSTSSP